MEKKKDLQAQSRPYMKLFSKFKATQLLLGYLKLVESKKKKFVKTPCSSRVKQIKKWCMQGFVIRDNNHSIFIVGIILYIQKQGLIRYTNQ